MQIRLWLDTQGRVHFKWWWKKARQESSRLDWEVCAKVYKGKRHWTVGLVKIRSKKKENSVGTRAQELHWGQKTGAVSLSRGTALSDGGRAVPQGKRQVWWDRVLGKTRILEMSWPAQERMTERGAFRCGSLPNENQNHCREVLADTCSLGCSGFPALSAGNGVLAFLWGPSVSSLSLGCGKGFRDEHLAQVRPITADMLQLEFLPWNHNKLRHTCFLLLLLAQNHFQDPFWEWSQQRTEKD